MKTSHIIATLRNAATPAARLAAWQTLPLQTRLAAIRARLAPGGCTYACNVPMPANPKDAKLSDWRRALIHDPAFYLASVPYVYESEDGKTASLTLESFNSPEVLREWDCKEAPARRWLEHTGWYTDEFQDETIRAAVVELKRFPGILFAATVESMGGMISVDLTTWEEVDFFNAFSESYASDLRDEYAHSVIQSADSIAKRLAEDEREYQTKWRMEQDLEENRETLATLRQSIRALCRELKTLCPGTLPQSFPAAAEAVKRELARLLNEREDLISENAKLRESIA